MSHDEIITVKIRVLEMFADLDDAELNLIEQWISSQSYKKELDKKKNLLKLDKTLQKIGHAVKKLVPFGAEMSTEKIVPPTIGDQADCTESNTCHVDEFLYDQNEVEELVKNGKLKRYYCLNCNSRNVKELIYISHSMSRQSLQYIFKVILPSDLQDKQILDVGSRLGTVLYGAYLLSNATTIVGIEMNKECCEVQNKIITKFMMDSKRLKVIQADVTERSDIVERSDVIIINVLDFFVDTEKHKEMWYFFKKYLKKGTYLVCNRSMEDTMNILDIYEELMDWLTICKPKQIENELLFDIEDYSEIFLYTVN